jgi:hypothetical protein
MHPKSWYAGDDFSSVIKYQGIMGDKVEFDWLQNGYIFKVAIRSTIACQ